MLWSSALLEDYYTNRVSVWSYLLDLKKKVVKFSLNHFVIEDTEFYYSHHHSNPKHLLKDICNIKVAYFITKSYYLNKLLKEEKEDQMLHCLISEHLSK